ncbi:helix-turn-helix domain-containing protein [Limnoglobus roseus]|uniref:helix-turn-helix domain-containing protein n=1 Tax=Limnoglobus roseus TaxID=2598579 RepID=UPI0011EB1141|nr:helix-turn-helix transcriptional regulator [Limnoglobus roseus]
MDQLDVKVLFGARVRHLRKEQGFSQEDFAHRVGLDRSYMGGVERGERNISLENICLIARALNLPVSQIFIGWTDVAPPENTPEE